MFITMRKYLFVCLLAMMASGASAQPLGNEWIDYSKTYYKCMVGRNGLHRISQPVLAAVGLSATPVTQFQLWRNGQQVPLFTSASSGSLPANGYIEFYGQKNDGTMEKALYKTDELQLSDRISLMTDTSAYYLTVNPSGGNLRMADIANPVAGNTIPAEAFFMHRLHRQFVHKINPGYGVDFGELVHSSSYERGEGWTSDNIAGGTALQDVTPNLYLYGAGPAGSISASVAGNYANSRNITLKVNDNTFGQSFVSGFDVRHFPEVTVPISTLAGNSANVQIVNEGSGVDKIVASRYTLRYPREFNFEGQMQFEFEVAGSATAKYLVISNFNYGNTAPILYDLTNNLRLTGDLLNGEVRFVLPAAAATRRLVLLNADVAGVTNIASLRPRSFTNFSQAANQGTYLIISHPRLFNDGAGNNNVEKYRQYRSSAAGGNYQAKTIDIEQLIDQFGYGIKQNPLAIRNFASFTLTNFTPIPKYFFLIGKGLSYDAFRQYENVPNVNGLALIPTFGYPASDNLLTADRTGTFSRIATSRLSALTGTEVGDYLEKVKQFEQAQASTTQTIADKGWMKNVAQITGAIDDPSLYGLITAYMQGYEQLISDTSFGGKVYNFSQNTGQYTAVGSNKVIDTLFQEGLSLLTYFGHSSPNTLEFNLDNPQNYSNAGKYPLIIVNGCNTGNLFLFDTLRAISKGTLSEKYVFAPQKGSIGFIASTHLGLPQQLNYVTAGFYNNLSNAMYGQGIGDIMKANMENVSNNYPFDYIARTHVEEITYHGDPAIRLNPHGLPDYSIQSSDIGFDPAVISVADEQIAVKIKVLNIGKAISDSISVRVQHRQPDNTLVTVASPRIKATLNEDNLLVNLPINPLRDKGLNQMIVTIDPANEVTELSEANNTITKDFTVLEDEIRPIFPYDYAIVGNAANLALYGSTANPTIGIKQYVMELDTSRNFNSALKVTRTISDSGGLIKFLPGIILVDSTVYYWRLAVGPVTANTRWLNSSFTYINGSTGGFAQKHYFQYTDNKMGGLSLNAVTRRLGFNDTQRKLLLRAGVYPFYSWDRNNINLNSDQLEFWGCVFTSLQFYVLDSLTQQPWLNFTTAGSGRFNSWPVCNSPRKFFEFPFSNADYRKRAMDFFDSIPSGQYVAVRNLVYEGFSNTFIDQWKADTATLGSGKSLWHKFKEMGLTQIDSFTNNRQFIFVFKKTGNGATEIRQRISPTVNTQLVDTFQLAGKDVVGTVETPWLGPARSWQRFKWDKDGNEDSTVTRYFDIIGRDNTGAEVQLTRVFNSRDTNVAYINAATYPYLKIRMYNENRQYAKATQLKYWMLTGSFMPEGAVSPNISFQFKDTLSPVDTLNFRVTFKNVTPIAFDSLKARITITDNYGNDHVFPLVSGTGTKLAPLAANDSIQLFYKIPAADYNGQNQLVLDVNPDNDQPEQFHFNNLLYRNFMVLNSPCPGNNIFYTSGYTGAYTYQWQVNTGSGYVNINNGANYTGTNGDTLRLLAPPTNWYGYKYRCTITDGVNTYFSGEYSLKFSMRWTGAVNTNWENPANWSCGSVPDQYTDVTIAGGLTNYPAVNFSTTCRSLSISTGASVTVRPGINLSVTGKN
jgi:hypothetical protein